MTILQLIGHEQDDVVRIVQHGVEVAGGSAHRLVLTRDFRIGLGQLPPPGVLQPEPIEELQRGNDPEQECGREDRQQQHEKALHGRLRGDIAGGEIVTLGSADICEHGSQRVAFAPRARAIGCAGGFDHSVWRSL